MKKGKMAVSILGCISVFLIACLVLLPAKKANAETLVESSLFYRIYVGFSVDQTALQAWLPAPWQAASLPKGPFGGTNLFVIFDDKMIQQDAEGKPDMGGVYCAAVLVAFGKNPQTEEFAPFVIRIYWPYDDPHAYKNGVKAMVYREATIKGATSESGAGSEIWKVKDSAEGILEFRMDYKRSVPKRTKREFKVRSSIEPDFFRIYRDDYADDLLKSVPVGIDRVQNYKFSVSIPELRKMFDGSEKLVGITVNPCRVRQVFLPLKVQVFHDNNTGLEWLAGPDKPTSWNDAKKWVESLTAVAGGGWRMPTIEELKTLYQKGEKCSIKPELKTSGCWIWSGETKGESLAWGYDYRYEPGSSILSGGSVTGSGPLTLNRGDSTNSSRGFAVRSRK